MASLSPVRPPAQRSLWLGEERVRERGINLPERKNDGRRKRF